MTVTQLPQYFPTFRAQPMNPRKLILQQQIQNQFGIAAVRLLSRSRAATNFSGMSNPYFMAQLLKHRFKPSAITAGLKADDYPTGELRIELSYFVLRLMPQ